MNLKNMGIKTCIKCGVGGNVLVCKSSHCVVAIHASCCAPSSLQVHHRENFFCPYCIYKQSVAECSQAKEEFLSTDRNLALFLGLNMSSNQEHEPNITKDKQTTLHNDEEHGNQEKGRKNKEMVQFLQTRTDLDNGEHVGRMRKMRIGEEFLRKCEGGSNIAMCFNGMTPEEYYVCSRQKGKVLAPIPLSYYNENAMGVAMHAKKLDNCNMEKGMELVTSGNNLGDRTINGKLAKKYVRHESSISSTSEGNGDEMNDSDNYSQGDISEYRDSGCNEPNAGNAGWIDKPSKKVPDGVRFRRHKRIRWSAEEEEMLKKGVLFFSSSANKNLPWRKILVYGNAVFHERRTPLDLQSKWKVMSRKEYNKSNEA